MYNWKEYKNIDTFLFSDSTEISPNSKVCINCCYQLDEKSGIREGSISLIDISGDIGRLITTQSKIDGILDCSWISETAVVLAGATGRLYFYGCDYNAFDNYKIIDVDVESLCLSIDYFRDRYLCSTSKGGVVLLNSDYNILVDRKVHDYEAWVCHLSRHHDHLYYSGGDDCKLKGFDLRIADKEIFSKQFDMGVTSIGSHPTNDNIISVGSYDEHLRLYDSRNIRQQLKDFNVGGGVWRHKWCPEGGPLVLVAAMYAGFAVVNTDEGDVVRLTDTSHTDSLGYGADWVKEGRDYVAVLSSFYDHRWSLTRLSYL